MIVRVPHKANYTIIANGALEDSRLSWKARGVLAYLLSKPDNWRVIVAHLVTQGPDGKAAITAALEELELYGYIRRTARRNVGGKYDGYDSEVFESPDETASENQTFDRDRLSGHGKSDTNKDGGLTRTELTKTEENFHVDSKSHARQAREIILGRK